MAHNHSHPAGQEACGCLGHGSSSVQQSMDEMEFERGIWLAACDGEDDRVQKFLSQGVSPDARDSSGLTALVIQKEILYFIVSYIPISIYFFSGLTALVIEKEILYLLLYMISIYFFFFYKLMIGICIPVHIEVIHDFHNGVDLPMLFLGLDLYERCVV